MVTFMTEQCVSNVVILNLTKLCLFHNVTNSFKVTMSLDLCNFNFWTEKNKKKTPGIRVNRLSSKHQDFRAFRAILSAQIAHKI